MSLSWSQRLKAAVIAGLAWPTVEGLAATWRWHEVGGEHLEPSALGDRTPIVAFWHGRILTAILYHRDKNMVALVSENFDGEWIARVIRRFGYRTARGSTTRGGARALVQLRRELRSGLPVAVTLDGPVGPARAAQAGAPWLAGATGHPLVPFHIEASDFWTINSWDRHQVPKPGSDVVVAVGTPIVVASTDEAAVEAARLDLEGALTQLELVARRALSSPGALTEVSG